MEVNCQEVTERLSEIFERNAHLIEIMEMRSMIIEARTSAEKGESFDFNKLSTPMLAGFVIGAGPDTELGRQADLVLSQRFRAIARNKDEGFEKEHSQ